MDIKLTTKEKMEIRNTMMDTNKEIFIKLANKLMGNRWIGVNYQIEEYNTNSFKCKKPTIRLNSGYMGNRMNLYFDYSIRIHINKFTGMDTYYNPVRKDINYTYYGHYGQFNLPEQKKEYIDTSATFLFYLMKHITTFDGKNVDLPEHETNQIGFNTVNDITEYQFRYDEPEVIQKITKLFHTKNYRRLQTRHKGNP